MPELILITGGARSGKSRFALELACDLSSQITFVATASSSDFEMEERINLHRKLRPSHWETVEERKDVATVLSQINSPQNVAVVDCLTLLISNLLLEGRKQEEILEQIEGIAKKGRKYNRATIVVSNQVGWGLVPSTRLGRDFRDILGTANQIVAKRASQVYLLVCGIARKLKEEKHEKR